jgi:hypothetical protein
LDLIEIAQSIWRAVKLWPWRANVGNHVRTRIFFFYGDSIGMTPTSCITSCGGAAGGEVSRSVAMAQVKLYRENLFIASSQWNASRSSRNAAYW